MISIDASLELIRFEGELDAEFKRLPKKPNEFLWKDHRTRRLLEWSSNGSVDVNVKFQLIDQQGVVGEGVIRGSFIGNRLARRKGQQDELEARLEELGYRTCKSGMVEESQGEVSKGDLARVAAIGAQAKT